jgi:shikimate 5-dehydrogenase
MPLKRTVVLLLDEMPARAAQARAANTVVLDAGRRVGHNTDIPVRSPRSASAHAVLPRR